MKHAIIVWILITLLAGCAAEKQVMVTEAPRPGQWIDPQTNIRFTLEERDNAVVVTGAKDMDDREELVILESVFELGVLRWSYYIPSTRFTVRCRTLEYTSETMHIRWDNDVVKGSEVLRRLK